jgi:uncharacterized protein YlaN (UPF0358 family)
MKKDDSEGLGKNKQSPYLKHRDVEEILKVMITTDNHLTITQIKKGLLNEKSMPSRYVLSKRLDLMSRLGLLERSSKEVYGKNQIAYGINSKLPRQVIERQFDPNKWAKLANIDWVDWASKILNS